MRDSPIFDAHTGFGGDGVPNTYRLPANWSSVKSKIPIDPYAWKGCVQDGPFASYNISLGPGQLVTDHCLVRSINDTYKQYITSESVLNATSQPNFELFRIELEGRPVTSTPKAHDGAHVLIGGDMSNVYSSVAGEFWFRFSLMIIEAPGLRCAVFEHVYLIRTCR
jgi:tyrosinase